MKKQFSFDQTTLLLLYNHYRVYTLSGIVFLFCIAVIFFYIIPQIQFLQKTNNDIKIAKEENAQLKKNLDILVSLQNKNFKDNYNLALTALPGGKDPAGIINAIANTSIKAGVAVDDFSFSLPEAKAKQEENKINITLTLKGNLDAIKSFASILQNALPLASVNSIEINEKEDPKVNISFYFSSFPAFTFSENQTLTLLSKEDEEVLKKISTWLGAPRKGIDNQFVPIPDLQQRSTDSPFE